AVIVPRLDRRPLKRLLAPERALDLEAVVELAHAHAELSKLARDARDAIALLVPQMRDAANPSAPARERRRHRERRHDVGHVGAVAIDPAEDSADDLHGIALFRDAASHLGEHVGGAEISLRRLAPDPFDSHGASSDRRRREEVARRGRIALDEMELASI